MHTIFFWEDVNFDKLFCICLDYIKSISIYQSRGFLSFFCYSESFNKNECYVFDYSYDLIKDVSCEDNAVNYLLSKCYEFGEINFIGFMYPFFSFDMSEDRCVCGYIFFGLDENNLKFVYSCSFLDHTDAKLIGDFIKNFIKKFEVKKFFNKNKLK